MNKNFIILGIVVLFIGVGLSGCNQVINTTPKHQTVWTEDIDYSYGWVDNATIYLYVNDHTYDSAGGMVNAVVDLYNYYNGTWIDGATYTTPPSYFNYTHTGLNPKKMYAFTVYITYDKDDDEWTKNITLYVLSKIPGP